MTLNEKFWSHRKISWLSIQYITDWAKQQINDAHIGNAEKIIKEVVNLIRDTQKMIV